MRLVNHAQHHHHHLHGPFEKLKTLKQANQPAAPRPTSSTSNGSSSQSAHTSSNNDGTGERENCNKTRESLSRCKKAQPHLEYDMTSVASLQAFCRIFDSQSRCCDNLLKVQNESKRGCMLFPFQFPWDRWAWLFPTRRRRDLPSLVRDQLESGARSLAMMMMPVVMLSCYSVGDLELIRGWLYWSHWSRLFGASLCSLIIRHGYHDVSHTLHCSGYLPFLPFLFGS